MVDKIKRECNRKTARIMNVILGLPPLFIATEAVATLSAHSEHIGLRAEAYGVTTVLKQDIKAKTNFKQRKCELGKLRQHC